MDPISGNNCFWLNFESRTSKFNPKSPVVIQGKNIFLSAEEGQKEMFSSCNMVAPIVQKCLDNQPKTAIDLGAGIGANSETLLKTGARVTLYEKELGLLKQAQQKLKGYGEKVILRRGDITTDRAFTKEGEEVDAILCIDVLPYLPNKALRKTLDKIHSSLREDGYFYGTFFVASPSHKKIRKNAIEMMEQLGANHLSSKEEAREILFRSGFDILNFEQTEDITAYQFVAKKMVLD